jgi:hypothetical protein
METTAGAKKARNFAPKPRRPALAGAMRPPKGPPRWAAASAARVAKIKEGLAAQDKLAREHAKQTPARPLKRGILQYIKKLAWER